MKSHLRETIFKNKLATPFLTLVILSISVAACSVKSWNQGLGGSPLTVTSEFPQLCLISGFTLNLAIIAIGCHFKKNVSVVAVVTSVPFALVCKSCGVAWHTFAPADLRLTAVSILIFVVWKLYKRHLDSIGTHLGLVWVLTSGLFFLGVFNFY